LSPLGASASAINFGKPINCVEQRLENIIVGCIGNNPSSQKMLYNYCFEQMIRVCLRYHHNIDDAAASYNEAMYKVFTKIDQYKQEGEFLGWVRRIVVNTCLNALRQAARFNVVTPADGEADHVPINPEAYSQLNHKEVLRLVQELPAASALVFNLYVMEGYTHEQIASHLGISPGTSKWHLSHARNVLKEKIKSMQRDESVKNA
jgi:RNA polymerase sigma-70 factor, ECF subfamily